VSVSAASEEFGSDRRWTVNLQNASQQGPQRRSPRVSGNGLVALGQPQFWLLSGILAFMLALVALIFFAYLSTR
jgi:hypothetical protein